MKQRRRGQYRGTASNRRYRFSSMRIGVEQLIPSVVRHGGSFSKYSFHSRRFVRGEVVLHVRRKTVTSIMILSQRCCHCLPTSTSRSREQCQQRFRCRSSGMLPSASSSQCRGCSFKAALTRPTTEEEPSSPTQRARIVTDRFRTLFAGNGTHRAGAFEGQRFESSGRRRFSIFDPAFTAAGRWGPNDDPLTTTPRHPLSAGCS